MNSEGSSGLLALPMWGFSVKGLVEWMINQMMDLTICTLV
jgi:hypothetical protein